jgi:hypothetical protein
MKEIKVGTQSKFLISQDRLLYEGQKLENSRLAVPEKSIQPIIEMCLLDASV